MKRRTGPDAPVIPEHLRAENRPSSDTEEWRPWLAEWRAWHRANGVLMLDTLREELAAHRAKHGGDAA